MEMFSYTFYTLLYFYLISPTFSLLSKPNVLVIIIDDLRPALGVYGDPNAHTPNLDKLADKSFIFHNTFAQQALCGPSRNSFLTSRRPDSLHLYDVNSYWRNAVGNFTTIPQYFKENGYYTHSIGKVFHPGKSSNYTDDCPYSWSKKPFHPRTEIYKNAKTCLNKDGSKASNLVCPVRIEDQPFETLPDIESARAASEFIKERTNGVEDVPYFLAVGFHKPHIPLKFPRKYLDHHPIENIVLPMNHYRSVELPSVAWNPWMDVKSRDDIAALNISFPYGEMPVANTRSIVQNYAAAVTYIDDLIGTILEEIDDNTIVLVFGDHGFSMGEHGEFAKYSNFDIATRVPLIIHAPPLATDMFESQQLVELVDIFPTLVDLTQVSKSLEICSRKTQILCTEGLSLAPHMIDLINGNDKKNRKNAVFTQYPRPSIYPKPISDQPNLEEIKIMGYSIRTDEFRYTEWIEFNPSSFAGNWSNVYGRELYDHAIDPGENMNLATRPQMTGIMKTLRKRLMLGWKNGYSS